MKKYSVKVMTGLECIEGLVFRGLEVLGGLEGLGALEGIEGLGGAW